MNEFVKQLIAKTGISEEQAQKVEQFVRDNISEVPKWIQGKDAAGLLEGGLGKFLGK